MVMQSCNAYMYMYTVQGLYSERLGGHYVGLYVVFSDFQYTLVLDCTFGYYPTPPTRLENRGGPRLCRRVLHVYLSSRDSISQAGSAFTPQPSQKQHQFHK